MNAHTAPLDPMNRDTAHGRMLRVRRAFLVAANEWLATQPGDAAIASEEHAAITALQTLRLLND